MATAGASRRERAREREKKKRRKKVKKEKGNKKKTKKKKKKAKKEEEEKEGKKREKKENNHSLRCGIHYKKYNADSKRHKKTLQPRTSIMAIGQAIHLLSQSLTREQVDTLQRLLQ